MERHNPIVVVVRLMPDGQVEVDGPLHNKLLCYGLLAAAHDAIREYKVPTGPQIAVVPAGAIQNLRG